MFLGTLGDVELRGEALQARLVELGLQGIFGHRSLKLDIRGNVDQVLRDLHCCTILSLESVPRPSVFMHTTLSCDGEGRICT